MPKRDGGKKDGTGRLKICPQTGRFASLSAFGAKIFPSNGTLRVPLRLRRQKFPLKRDASRPFAPSAPKFSPKIRKKADASRPRKTENLEKKTLVS